MERIGEVVEALSSLARTGWMLRGVPSQLAETVAEHLFTSALLALEIGFRAKDRGLNLDPYRAAVIALVHDVAESVIGDIPKTAGIDKSEAERRALASLPLHGEVLRLFEEFEEASTLEALVARIAELGATVVRARRYRELGYTRVEEIEESSIGAMERLLEGAPGPIRMAVEDVLSNRPMKPASDGD
ncbi:MAG: HD family hydrolase [Desulfurococcales archaeon]|nr:HD family hydrolase [Desulfurococcales archaeon]